MKDLIIITLILVMGFIVLSEKKQCQDRYFEFSRHVLDDAQNCVDNGLLPVISFGKGFVSHSVNCYEANTTEGGD